MKSVVRIALVLAFVTGTAILVAANSKYANMSVMGELEVSRCYLNLYYSLPSEVRVLLLGTSRVRRGVEPELLAESLKLPPKAVANLGHPGGSLALDYSIAERVSREQHISLVVFGVRAQSDRLASISKLLHRAARRGEPIPEMTEREVRLHGWRARNRLIGLASGKVERRYVIGAPISAQARDAWRRTESPVLASWDISRLFVKKVEETIPMIFEGLLLDLALAKQVEEPELVCHKSEWSRPEDRFQHGNAQERQSKDFHREFFLGLDSRQAWVDPDPLAFLTSEATADERSWIQDLVALGEARGFRVVFLYLPRIHVPIDHERLSKEFEREFSVPLLIPSPALRARLEKSGYVDQSHLNLSGRDELTRWLGAELGPVRESR